MSFMKHSKCVFRVMLGGYENCGVPGVSSANRGRPRGELFKSVEAECLPLEVIN